jgi:hypothetical protein
VYYGRQGPSVGCVLMQIYGAVWAAIIVTYGAGYLDLAVVRTPLLSLLVFLVWFV